LPTAFYAVKTQFSGITLRRYRNCDEPVSYKDHLKPRAGKELPPKLHPMRASRRRRIRDRLPREGRSERLPRGEPRHHQRPGRGTQRSNTERERRLQRRTAELHERELNIIFSAGAERQSVCEVVLMCSLVRHPTVKYRFGSCKSPQAMVRAAYRTVANQ
jgi:hypothetical protein